MFRKILLLICIAYVVVCYGYPCLLLPFGSYTYSYEDMSGNKQEMSIQFKFNGTMTTEGSEDVSYYKLKGNKVIISEDESFDESDLTLTLKNMYEFEMPVLLMNCSFRNNIGLYISLGIGGLATILVLTIPKSKRR